jgi:hypothetical protein
MDGLSDSSFFDNMVVSRLSCKQSSRESAMGSDKTVDKDFVNHPLACGHPLTCGFYHADDALIKKTTFSWCYTFLCKSLWIKSDIEVLKLWPSSSKLSDTAQAETDESVEALVEFGSRVGRNGGPTSGRSVLQF